MILDARLQRKRKGKSPRKVYAIFCEWKSEKIYFEYLKTKYGKNLICFELRNKDYKWIADEIEKKLKDNELSDDFAYCVIDKDNHSLSECKSGCEQIENYAKVILSCKSFEIRVLMHFSPFEKSVLNVEEYKLFINSKENKEFFKSKNVTKEVWKPYSREVWEALSEKTKIAIRNAKMVSKRQLKENNSKFECEAYSDIRDLVEKLLGFKNS